MILVLDNYDSFTYNLVQYLESLGARLKVVRNDEMNIDRILALEPSAIVLSPGPGRPESSGVMNELIEAVAGDIPMLGVCLGHQAIAQVFGAKVDYAPAVMHGKTSRISHDGSALFCDIESPFEATRYHSLTVDKGSMPDDLKVTAWTDQGVIMGLQHRTLPLFGVQFHPESIMTASGMKILGNFLEVVG